MTDEPTTVLDPRSRQSTWAAALVLLQHAAAAGVPVASDMTSGAIDRFRSRPILPSAVLIGHVTAGLIRNLCSTVLVLAVAFAIGFRPVIETLGGLMTGTPVAGAAWTAVAWFGGLLIVAYAVATILFNRRTSRG